MLAKVLHTIEQWKQGAAVLAIVGFGLVMSAFPLAFVGMLFGEITDRPVNVLVWAGFSVFVFGPYMLSGVVALRETLADTGRR